MNDKCPFSSINRPLGRVIGLFEIQVQDEGQPPLTWDNLDEEIKDPISHRIRPSQLDDIIPQRQNPLPQLIKKSARFGSEFKIINLVFGRILRQLFKLSSSYRTRVHPE